VPDGDRRMNTAERLLRWLPAPIERRLRRLVPQGELTRGVLTLVFGTTIAQGLLIVTSPILTRLYSPADVGAYGVATSILAVLLTVTCLTYDWAVALPEDDVAAANVLALCLVVNLVMTLVCGLALALLAPTLLIGFGLAQIGAYVVLLAIDQLGGGVGLAFTGWAIRTKSFTDLATARVTQSGATVAVQIGLGLIVFGPLGLLVADIVGRLGGAAQLARTAWRSSAPAFRRTTRGGIRVAAVRYRRFPIYSTGSAVLNQLGLQAPLLLLVALYGTQTGGHYLLAQRVAALPLILVAGSVGQVFFAEAARLAREQPRALAGLFLRGTRSLARGGIVPSVVVMALAPFVFAPIFGGDWQQAGIFAALLAPMYFLSLVTSPTGSTLDVLERQDLHLVRELLRLLLVGGAVLFAASLHFSSTAAVAVLSVAGCATYVMYGLISWWAIVRHAAGLEPEGPAAG
jgi:O-antigen/teichoic acid export membrane protein